MILHQYINKGIDIVQKLPPRNSYYFNNSILKLQMNFGESLPNLPIKTSQKRTQFYLTEAQKLYIQYFLPKKYTLLPISQSCSRINLNSQKLISQSMQFINRKRGRPQGSSNIKKTSNKSDSERRSLRLASSKDKRAYNLKKRDQFQHNPSQSDNSNSIEIDQTEGLYGIDSLFQLKENSYQREILILNNEEPVSIEEKLAQGQIQGKVLLDDLSFPCPDKLEKDSISKLPQIIVTPQKQQNSCKNKKNIKENATINKVKDIKTNTTKDNKIQQLSNQPQPKSKKHAKDQHTRKLQSQTPFNLEIDILLKLKNHQEILPFIEPVDEQRDGAPNYYKTISHPIDLQTIQFKLNNNIYKQTEEFHCDIRRMWANSKSYNKDNRFMMKVTDQLQNFYLCLLEKSKKSRIKKE